MAKRIRHTRSTLLVVGEGDTEVAFLRHLRAIFCSDGKGVEVTIRNAYGKGPENVINTVTGHCRSVDYDHRMAFLDTDLVWTAGLKKEARAKKIEMIGSTPCIEGLLLQILGESVPSSSSVCKRKLQDLLGSDMTDRDHYGSRFSHEVLMAARLKIPALHALLNRFEGGK